MRIVLDTNFLIASFISHGVCHELFNYLISSNHILLISDWIVEELKEKLHNKFKYTKKEISAVTSLLKAVCKIYYNVTILESQVCRDRDDDNILSLAINKKVDCIITGDKDLLVLNPYKNIKIILPKNFWEIEIKR